MKAIHTIDDENPATVISWYKYGESMVPRTIPEDKVCAKRDVFLQDSIP